MSLALKGTVSADPVTNAPGNCLPRPYCGIFGRHLQYQSVDHRFDILWDNIKDDLRVFWLPDPETEQQGEERAGVIAMFHQLHCLQSLRSAIQMGHEGTDPGFDRWTDDNMHWPLCLDYMRSVSRQVPAFSIQCSSSNFDTGGRQFFAGPTIRWRGGRTLTTVPLARLLRVILMTGNAVTTGN